MNGGPRAKLWFARTPSSDYFAAMNGNSTTGARWDALEFMVDFHTREKRLGLLSETLGWVASVALFRETERQTHYLRQPTSADRRQHKALLATLIGEGTRLLNRIHNARGLPKNLDGVKTADVDAMVEELRNTQLQWEGDMNPRRREQILKELFDVPAC
jgi:hypothetical protein